MMNSRARFKVGHLYQYQKESVRIICYTDDSAVTTKGRTGKAGSRHVVREVRSESTIMVVASNHDSPGDASFYKVVMDDGTMGWINLAYLGRQNFIEVKGD